jgi:RecA/RadA recombinase
MDTNKSNVSPTSSSLSSLISTYPVKLIILDSIAAPTRRDFGGEDAKERVNAILQIAQMLKQISGELNVSIVVINQIENNGNRNSNRNRNNLGRSYGNTNHQQSTITPVKASLGTSWHHCVSTRVLLEYVHDYGDDNGNGNDYGSTTGIRQGRKATVVKNNLVGCASVNFEVTRMMGICHCHSLYE